MVLLMLSLAGTAMASITGNTSGLTPKDPGTPYVNPPEPLERQGGDTFLTAYPITAALPFTDTGVTGGYINDYDAACPYTGGTAPEVVYSYSPLPGVVAINVDLCLSSYDTKVYVYDALDTATPIACNDDYYFALPCYTYASFVGPVCVLQGHTYYIVVDGYGSSSGTYQIDVTDAGVCPATGACCAVSGACTVTTEADCILPSIWHGENTICVPDLCPPPPPIECPAGALIEGEPPCPGTDNYNGGCNSTPTIFQAVNPQGASPGCATMCGRSCTTTTTRDTDWFDIIGSGQTVTVTCVAEFPLQLLLLNDSNCPAAVYSSAVADPGVPVTHPVRGRRRAHDRMGRCVGVRGLARGQLRVGHLRHPERSAASGRLLPERSVHRDHPGSLPVHGRRVPG